MTSTLPSASAATAPHERLCMMRLARTAGIGPVNFTRLIGLYGSASRALDALPERIRRTGRPVPTIPSATEIEDEIAALAKKGAQPVLRSDPEYPLLLTHIPDAPPILYAQGNLDLLSLSGLGIVGARNASTAGLRLAESISAELAAEGVCVVSGLARGIDAAAHRGALHRGLTVAAIAGGLDVPYPPENTALQNSIAEQGCIITEAPLGTVPQSRHFPRRNRLIAGLTQGCLVIEAAQRSGTLITARLAESYLRTVFATPGSPIDPRSRGGNQLIKQGCILVENAEDIISALPRYLPARQPAPWSRDALTQDTLFCHNTESSQPSDNTTSSRDYAEPRQKKENSPHNKTETKAEEAFSQPEDQQNINETLLTLLSITPVPVDEIVSRCHFSVSAVATALSELELDGIVERLPGGRVARLPDMTQ